MSNLWPLEPGLSYRAEWSASKKQWRASVQAGGRMLNHVWLPRCGQREAIRAARALLELEKLKRGAT